MSVTLHDRLPPTLHRRLGPYRRNDHAVLPDEPRCELIYGRFCPSPSPTPLHQYVALRLGRLLDDVAERTGGLALLAPVDVHLAQHSVVQPDLLYISADRSEIIQDRIEGAPDLAVEILSPSTASRDQVHKLNLYAQAGVAEYWIVDPARVHIAFLVSDRGAFTVRLPESGRWSSPALPEVELDIDGFWETVERKFGPSSGR